MPITFVNDSATIGSTEYFFASDSTTKVDQTDDCLLQLFVDVGAMAAGDRFQFKVYEKINGGTQRVLYDVTLDGVQDTPLVIPGLILGEAWEASGKKLAGTDRSIGWSLRKVS